MKLSNTLCVVSAAIATVAGSAQAGSYTPPVVAPPAVVAPAGHDWSGWYGDVYAGHWFNPAIGNFGGANVGYLVNGGSLLYGGEVGLLYDPSLGNYTQFTIDGRIATPVSNDAMAFANLGLGRDSIAVTFVEYSVGGQYAFSNNMYMRGEIIGQTAISGATGTTSAIRLGAGWEF